MTKAIHRPEHTALLEALKALRQDSGLTQVQCAEALGRPQSFVSAYETGIRRLDLVQLHDLCKVLKIDLKTLVERFEENLSKIGKS